MSKKCVWANVSYNATNDMNLDPCNATNVSLEFLNFIQIWDVGIIKF